MKCEEFLMMAHLRRRVDEAMEAELLELEQTVKDCLSSKYYQYLGEGDMEGITFVLAKVRELQVPLFETLKKERNDIFTLRKISSFMNDDSFSQILNEYYNEGPKILISGAKIKLLMEACQLADDLAEANEFTIGGKEE